MYVRLILLRYITQVRVLCCIRLHTRIFVWPKINVILPEISVCVSTLGLTFPILNTFLYGYSISENKYDITVYNVQSNCLDKYCTLLYRFYNGAEKILLFSVNTCNTIDGRTKIIVCVLRQWKWRYLT